MMRYTFLIILSICCLCNYGFAQKDIQKKLQKEFSMIQDGGIITLEAGFFELKKPLLLNGKKNITIKGAGKDKTILSFKNQKRRGASGIKITNAEHIELEGLTIQDTRGVAIYAKKVSDISIHKIKTKNRVTKKSKGFHGLSMIDCTKIKIEGCEIISASDAGIYLGQSNKAIIRNCQMYQNGIGIKIENTSNAEIYKNTVHENAIGIMVADVPDLIKKNGQFNRIYNNRIINNNQTKNLSKRNIANHFPVGVGVIVLAGSDIEIFNNDIEAHKTFGMVIASYFITDRKAKDAQYDPYSYRISVHDNRFVRVAQEPDLEHQLGAVVFNKFGQNIPDIAIDGIFNPDQINEFGWFNDGFRICIYDNDDAVLLHLDAVNNYENLDTKPYPFRCELVPFKGLIDEAFEKKKYEPSEIKQ